MFIIKNKELQTTEYKFQILKPDTTIEIVGEIPISSTVMCHVVGFSEEYMFPLMYKETLDIGNVFSSIFYIDSICTNYFKKYPDKEYKIYFTVDKLKLNNEQSIIFNPKLKHNSNNLLEGLVKQVSEILQKINIINMPFEPNKDIKKGMIPVATGIGKQYTWDYPFETLSEIVKELSDIVTKLSNENLNLTNRVNDLEKNMIKHIYEQYEL